MRATVDNYFETLFDAGEAVCFAWYPNDSAVMSLKHREDQRSPWVSVNPLFIDKDLDPESSILPWAKNDKGRRADLNVSTLRNILIEMDEIPLGKQWQIIRDIGMPFSTSVFSGGKSIHFVIPLSDPCATRSEYDELFTMVTTAIRVDVDTACRNPSRLTRQPDVMRDDKKKQQKLLEVRGRVSKYDLKLWCNSRGVLSVPRKIFLPVVHHNDGRLPAWLNHFLANGADLFTRNKTAYRAACRMAEAGLSQHEILVRMQGVPGLITNGKEAREIANTVRSACRRLKIN